MKWLPAALSLLLLGCGPKCVEQKCETVTIPAKPARSEFGYCYQPWQGKFAAGMCKKAAVPEHKEERCTCVKWEDSK